MLVDTEKIIKEFLDIKTSRDLADFLHIEYKRLTYILYGIPQVERYVEFEINKRSGGTRKIFAPNSNIKNTQRLLNDILQIAFSQKSCIHGFVKSKSIITNAKEHLNKRILINLDLENFFPSINFGRVRGLFLSYPFNFNETIATILAQICCFNGYLPQGAPTSPIISNYICRKLDNQLLRLATENKCKYTRYADDITFSTNLKELPGNIGKIENQNLLLSIKLIEIIESNGFKINNKKVRFAFRNNRQEVTGLIINEKLNVKRKYYKQVRSMLHAWEKYGVEAAALEHFEKFNLQNKQVINASFTFEKQIIGKIGFIGSVKGKSNSTYKNLCKRLKLLSPQVRLSIIRKESELETLPVVYGEGTTDCKHLRAALSKFNAEGHYTDLDIRFKEYPDFMKMNNSQLYEMCKNYSRDNIFKSKMIFLFDRDDKNYTSKVVNAGSDFKYWGNNIYSMLLPLPPHQSFSEVCIEHFYLKEELKTLDKHGRRIFLGDEFDERTGEHLEDELIYKDITKLKRTYPFVIDEKVIDRDNKNVALPKNDFANYILEKEKGYDNFTFEHFKMIFEILQNILKN